MLFIVLTTIYLNESVRNMIKHEDIWLGTYKMIVDLNNFPCTTRTLVISVKIYLRPQNKYLFTAFNNTFFPFKYCIVDPFYGYNKFNAYLFMIIPGSYCVSLYLHNILFRDHTGICVCRQVFNFWILSIVDMNVKVSVR